MDCLFCKIIRKEIPANIVYEDEKTLAFLDIRPINQGHTLVIPKEHFEHCLETSDEALAAIMKTVKQIAPGILKAVGAEGFNLGVNCGQVAGQVIFHTHLHIMPRFTNDGHEMWHGKAMSSQDLSSLAAKIKKAQQ